MLVAGVVSFIRVSPGLKQVQVQLDKTSTVYQLTDGLTFDDLRRILVASWIGSIEVLLDVSDQPASAGTASVYEIITVAGGVFTP